MHVFIHRLKFHGAGSLHDRVQSFEYFHQHFSRATRCPSFPSHFPSPDCHLFSLQQLFIMTSITPSNPPGKNVAHIRFIFAIFAIYSFWCSLFTLIASLPANYREYDNFLLLGSVHLYLETWSHCTYTCHLQYFLHIPTCLQFAP